MTERIGCSITVSGLSHLFAGDARGLVELARMTDDLGIDQLLLPDHLAIGPRTDRYPYGRFPLPDDEPWPEPLVVLASLASVTTRVRLGTGVLIAPLRPPLLLAKQAATLDQLSGGRLDLGVGVGWQAEEFAGVRPFEKRWRTLDETLRACRALWCEDPSTFSWDGAKVEALRAFPKPLQAGGVPVWLGVAPTAAGSRRIAEHAVGWMPMDGSPEALRAGLAPVRQALAEAGRSHEGFGVRAHAPIVLDADRRPDLERTLNRLPELAEAGATLASFAVAAFCRTPESVRPFVERLAEATR